mmetsp:Transcript_15897/g.34802  ORF Transcript_15897/g.34802 Transcript_15897/m.34802 type:complete len:238 (-) Transcript_15897:945-1658(-)
MPSLSGEDSKEDFSKLVFSKTQMRKTMITRAVESCVRYRRAWLLTELFPLRTSSSSPSTRPVMSSSVPAAAENRITTTVGVLARYIMMAIKKVVPCERSAMLTELSPAVRVETAWKKAFQTLSITERPFKATESQSCHIMTSIQATLRMTTTSSSQSVCVAGNMWVKQRRGCSRRNPKAARFSDPTLESRAMTYAISRIMIGRQVFPRRTRAPIVLRRRGLLAKSITEEGVRTRPLF